MKINNTDTGFQISLPYGAVDKLHPEGHTGVDIPLEVGTPLYSIGKGTVEKVVNYGDVNTGKTVIVQLESGERVVYGHLSDAKVQTGDSVEMGELLALSGNSGTSTAPHLHLAVKDGYTPKDPTSFVDEALGDPNNPWIPDFIEKPITGVKSGYDNFNNQLAELNNKLDTVGYWINPKNLAVEGWKGLEALITSPFTATWLLSGTIIGVWLMMLGAKWPKKYIWWGWISFWVLRGFVFG